MNALPRNEAPHNTRPLGTIILRIVIIVVILICAAYLKLGGSAYDGMSQTQMAVANIRMVIGKVHLTTRWSAPQTDGIPWAIERPDLPYVVEYTTTKYGVVSETIPPRQSRGRDWVPQYPNPEATSVRFALPEGLGVETADLLLYSR